MGGNKKARWVWCLVDATKIKTSLVAGHLQVIGYTSQIVMLMSYEHSILFTSIAISYIRASSQCKKDSSHY
jgi:hypothetical protein